MKLINSNTKSTLKSNAHLAHALEEESINNVGLRNRSAGGEGVVRVVSRHQRRVVSLRARAPPAVGAEQRESAHHEADGAALDDRQPHAERRLQERRHARHEERGADECALLVRRAADAERVRKRQRTH